MIRLIGGVIAAALIIVLALVLLWPTGAFAAPCKGQMVRVSWYGKETCHGRPPGHGKGRCQTANGTPFDGTQWLVAHKTLPMGTKVRFTNKHGTSVVAPVADRGPYVAGRSYDLARPVARALGITGVERVCAERL